jgi:hypothetical protein
VWQEQNRQLRAVTVDALALARELRKDTIERVLGIDARTTVSAIKPHTFIGAQMAKAA